MDLRMTRYHHSGEDWDQSWDLLLENWIKSTEPQTRTNFLLCSHNGSSGTQGTNEEVLIFLPIPDYKQLS